MKIFTPDFTKVDPKTIAAEVQAKGFYCFDRALTEEFMNAVESDVQANRFGLNENFVRGVYVEKQYFLTHMLSVSKAFFDGVCHPIVQAVSRELLGPRFRLKAMRYYETMGRHHMQWHTDNKTDRGFAPIPGIIFIAYLSDVNDGEFQYVAGSHEWSGETAYSDYSDEEINTKYGNKVVSFRKPRGTLLIYNTYGIHRAKPSKNRSYLRKSIFFQIDNEMSNAEPVVLNAQFCKDLSPELQEFLGFGLPANYEVFPPSKLNQLPMSQMLAKNAIRWFAYRFLRFGFDHLPTFLKNRVKSIMKERV